MASSSAIMNPLVGIPITEKLSKSNHAMWRAQILAVVQGSRLAGHLTGAIPAPAEEIADKDAAGKEVMVPNLTFEEWYAKDQQVLSFVFGSLAQEVMSQVTAKEIAAQLWSAIEDMFSSQTRARATNTCLALATAWKGNQSVAEFVGKMRALGDEMAAAAEHLKRRSLSSTSSPASTSISTRLFLPSL